MGLLDLFKPKTQAIVIPRDVELDFVEDQLELAKLDDLITSRIQKALNPASNLYQMTQTDNGIGFFNQEFNIRAFSESLKKAYLSEPWIFGIANMISKSMITVPMVVKDKATDEINDTHPLNQKIHCGNQYQSAMRIDWAGNIDMLLSGNFFLVYDENYEECVHVQAEFANIRFDDGLPYELEIYDKENPSKISDRVPWDRVVQYAMPNPFDNYYGLSIFVASARPILLDRMKNEYEMAFYLRGSASPGVIETDQDISKTRMKMLLRTFEQNFSGKRNWWRPTFLPKGAHWKGVGYTLQAMQHVELLKENRISICGALNIPPAKVGITESVNRSNSEVQDRDYWQDTIKPILDFKADCFNNSHLVKRIYGGEVYVAPDYSVIEALQGSLETKGKQAKSVERYLTINEIRTDILGYPALEDERGDLFANEVSRQGQDPQALLSLSVAKEDPEPDTKLDPIQRQKKIAEEGQTEIEESLTKKYISNFNKVYLDKLYTIARKALLKGQDVRGALLEAQEVLERSYVFAIMDELQKALNKGFSFATNQAKSVSPKFVRRKNLKTKSLDKRSEKRLRFSEIDLEAVEVLRKRDEDGQLQTLVERAISNFVGMNQTKTEQIMNIIADGFEDGQTTEQIAESIRENHQERYGDQSFTIARTEILSAVSQGLNWNKNVLGEIFSEVQKQWFHVGDVGSNPDARENHADFEGLGPQATNYKYGNLLEYPRDPNAPADEVINCRCTMVSFIPDSATSNAEIILEQNQ